jgi:hypothetical protein
MERKSSVYPIKLIDPNIKTRIINAVVLNAKFLASKYKGVSWLNVAKDQLADFDINITKSTIGSVFRKLKQGNRSFNKASMFSGNLRSRYEKDGMYRELDRTIDIFLNKEIKYIGLPADQILDFSNRYSSITACEINPETIELMQWINDEFNCGAKIVNSELFSYLNSTDEKFNFFDLDLMVAITSAEQVIEYMESIDRCAEDKIVVSLATCIGRNGYSNAQYYSLVPGLMKHYFEILGWNVLYKYSGGYTDYITPMRYEHLVLEK